MEIMEMFSRPWRHRTSAAEDWEQRWPCKSDPTAECLVVKKCLASARARDIENMYNTCRLLCTYRHMCMLYTYIQLIGYVVWKDP